MTASESTQEKSSSQLHQSDDTVLQGLSNNIVDFEDSRDGYNPNNWAFSKKVFTSLLYSLTSLGSVWASTAYVCRTHHVRRLAKQQQATRQRMPRSPSTSMSTLS
jgi:hypothetical protein